MTSDFVTPEGGTITTQTSRSEHVASARNEGRAAPTEVPDLTTRTFHHVSELRAWGVEPHGTNDEWFAFVSASEAAAIRGATS